MSGNTAVADNVNFYGDCDNDACAVPVYDHTHSSGSLSLPADGGFRGTEPGQGGHDHNVDVDLPYWDTALVNSNNTTAVSSWPPFTVVSLCVSP